MNSIFSHMKHQIDKRRLLGNLRELKISQKSIDFASNDYLGLLHDNYFGCLVGSSGSRLLTGNTARYVELENEIAHFHEEEAGLIFNSGYCANLGLLSTLATSQDTVIHDQDVHASIHDAIKLSRAKALPFRHLDCNHLAHRLTQGIGRVFVCVESIYSCDGRASQLDEVSRLCQLAGAHLIVDEAHATGWYGDKGEGAVQSHGLQGKIFARVHTFSKALGGQGAIVVGSSLLRDYLINFARPFIYTTALPPMSLSVICAAYRALTSLKETREKLIHLITYFRENIKKCTVQWEDSFSPIQCVRIRGNHEVKKKAEQLQQEGFDVRPLLSPTVKRGKECLRICLHAFNKTEEIDALIERLI